MKSTLKIARRFIPIAIFRPCASLVLAVSMGTIEPAYLAGALSVKEKGTSCAENLAPYISRGTAFFKPGASSRIATSAIG